MTIDWLACPAVESVPSRMSGVPVIRETRVRPEDLLVNRTEGMIWLVENFGISAEIVGDVLAFYDSYQATARAPAHHPG